MFPHMKKYIYNGLGILVVTTLSACQTAPFTGIYKSPDVETYSESGEPITLSNVKNFEAGIIKAFPDVPIPSTHRADLEKTVIFTSPTQTVGKVTLEGKGDVDSLFRFYDEQMKSNGWSLVNAFESSTSSMYFAKPGRFVAIIIEATATGSRVYLNVGPE